MKTTWVLVADASRARIFAVAPGGEWTVLRTFDHPESRLAGHELVSDGPGTVRQSATGSRPTMTPTTPPKENEARRFAHELLSAVEDGFGQGAFHSLVLCAPPHMLGLLRGGLTRPVERLLLDSVGKDYTHLADREVPAYLAGALSR